MNKIQFRAWYPEKQKMYEVAKIDMWGDPDQATCDLAAIDEELFDIYLCEVETMQYIGIRDKYNREICEGDIVTGLFNHTDIIGHIVYGSDATFFIERKVLYGIGLNNAEDWLEVVGNIYENPELLE